MVVEWLPHLLAGLAALALEALVVLVVLLLVVLLLVVLLLVVLLAHSHHTSAFHSNYVDLHFASNYR